MSTAPIRANADACLDPAQRASRPQCIVADLGHEIAALAEIVNNGDHLGADIRIMAVEAALAALRATSLAGALAQVYQVANIASRLGSEAHQITTKISGPDNVIRRLATIEDPADRLMAMAYSIAAVIEAEHGFPRKEYGGAYYMPERTNPHEIHRQTVGRAPHA